MKTTDKYVFFFTYKDFLSNFYPCSFTYRGFKFDNSEKAIMWSKAMHFGAIEVANQILQAPNPKEAKRLGRSKQIPFVESEWEQVREQVFYDILMAKFSVPNMKSKLLETGDRKLAEASPYDTIWGVGLSENDPRIFDESEWKGQNLLGKVLMKVREDIKNG